MGPTRQVVRRLSAQALGEVAGVVEGVGERLDIKEQEKALIEIAFSMK